MPALSDNAKNSRSGRSAASVLPEPVGATRRTSDPFRISTSAVTCIGLSCRIPALAKSAFEIALVPCVALVHGKACSKDLHANKLISETCELGDVSSNYDWYKQEATL